MTQQSTTTGETSTSTRTCSTKQSKTTRQQSKSSPSTRNSIMHSASRMKLKLCKSKRRSSEKGSKMKTMKKTKRIWTRLRHHKGRPLRSHHSRALSKQRFSHWSNGQSGTTSKRYKWTRSSSRADSMPLLCSRRFTTSPTHWSNWQRSSKCEKMTRRSGYSVVLSSRIWATTN